MLAQHLNDQLPVGANLIRDLNHEHCLCPPADGVFIPAGTMSWPVFGHMAQQVAQEVHAEALPGAALEHSPDRRREPQVGVRDHQPGSTK